MVSQFSNFPFNHSVFSGDSIQNILGDLFSCGLGYIIGTVFLAVELWWLSLVWILISEVISNLLWIRFNQFDILLSRLSASGT